MTAEQGSNLTLYDYWRSSASYRVRICLHLKGLPFEQRAINLVHDGGEQHKDVYRQLNPQGLVPALVHGGHVVTQSLAICEYLDDVFPDPPLLPVDPYFKAEARAMALSIACDIHPLNNLRVQQYLKGELEVSGHDVVAWMNHWVGVGFSALETRLSASGKTGLYCVGDEPGLVDSFLIPQVYNAERFNCDMSRFPLISRIIRHCKNLPAFAAAAPANQPDAPAG